MSSIKGKRFDAKLKKDIVKLYLSGTHTCPSLAEKLVLHENTVYKWIEQYKNTPEQFSQMQLVKNIVGGGLGPAHAIADQPELLVEAEKAGYALA